MSNAIDFLTNMLAIAVAATYIVDVSGFTQSWRAGLSSLLNVRNLRPLKPFDCGTCMVFWSELIYIVATHQFSPVTMAAACIFSLITVPLGQLCIFIRESLTALINKMWE